MSRITWEAAQVSGIVRVSSEGCLRRASAKPGKRPGRKSLA